MDDGLVFLDPLDEPLDPLRRRGLIGLAVASLDADHLGRLVAGHVAQGASDAFEHLRLGLAHGRVLHHSRNVCGATG
jgi:hypothetical protein